MQRPRVARVRERLLIWHLWGQMPAVPVSPSSSLLLGSSYTHTLSEYFSRGRLIPCTVLLLIQGVVDPGRDLALAFLPSHVVPRDE